MKSLTYNRRDFPLRSIGNRQFYAVMASSLVEAPSSSVERVNNKIASPPPLDDDDDDDEFSRLLNAHKKARGDPGGAPRLNQVLLEPLMLITH